uniref:Uncharacterized protein n=1 Tax=Anopheles coluzzii TaxID=1518534 RepID=A0A8W7NZH7_ANOCL
MAKNERKHSPPACITEWSSVRRMQWTADGKALSIIASLNGACEYLTSVCSTSSAMSGASDAHERRDDAILQRQQAERVLRQYLQHILHHLDQKPVVVELLEDGHRNGDYLRAQRGRYVHIELTIGLSIDRLSTVTFTICSMNGWRRMSHSQNRLSSHRQRPSRYGDAWLSISILISAKYCPISKLAGLSTIMSLNEPTASIDDSWIFHQCGLPAFRSTSATALCLPSASVKQGSSCCSYSRPTISSTSCAVTRIVNSTPCSSSSSTNFSGSSSHCWACSSHGNVDEIGQHVHDRRLVLLHLDDRVHKLEYLQYHLREIFHPIVIAVLVGAVKRGGFAFVHHDFHVKVGQLRQQLPDRGQDRSDLLCGPFGAVRPSISRCIKFGSTGLRMADFSWRVSMFVLMLRSSEYSISTAYLRAVTLYWLAAVKIRYTSERISGATSPTCRSSSSVNSTSTFIAPSTEFSVPLRHLTITSNSSCQSPGQSYSAMFAMQ